MAFITMRKALATLCIAAMCVGDTVIADSSAWQVVPPTSSSSPSLQDEASPPISADQLDSLVAPVALYPDPLLAQTLAASTYPLEIMQLQQWLAKNAELKGSALAGAVAKQPWDPSIQSMAVLPDVVKRLADDIQWTTDLGNAFLAQQSDVMDAVQRMRQKAEGKGNLKTTNEQVVETKVIENKSVIVIESSQPETVYVPSYDPVAVYGAPIYPYPPIYYPPAGYYAAGMAVSFGVGVAMGAFWGSGGGWGWNAGWGHNDININRNNNFNRNTNISANRAGSMNNTWRHNSAHRGGAPYRDRATANQFGGTTRADSLSSRQSAARQQINRQGGNLSSRPTGTNSVNRQPGSGATAGARAAGDRASSGSLGTRSAGGGDRVGQRDVARPSGGQTAFGGGSQSFDGSRARSSSNRGASSFQSRSGSGSRPSGGSRSGARSGGGSRGGGRR